MRHRHRIAAGALAALAAFFATHAYHWHFPDRIDGIAGELPLLAAALIAGAVLGFAVGRLRRRWAAARVTIASVAALAAFVILQAADPFVAARSWRYVAAGCDFAVEFPRRAEIAEGEIHLAGRAPAKVRRAVYTAVGEGRALSAECVALGRDIDTNARAALLDAAEEQLKLSAVRLKLRIDSVAREGRDVIVLSGTSDEGRTATNETMLRRARADVRLGRSSLLIVWGWRIEREGDARRISPLTGLAIKAAR